MSHFCSKDDGPLNTQSLLQWHR